jgi:2-oxoglutarate dehydrogenase E2 component (dihydrolipoamide succinyltransferase)
VALPPVQAGIYDASSHPAGIVMPAAARLMSENDLGYNDVTGTGKDGRILKEDVLRAMEIGPDVGRLTSSPPSLQSVPYSPPSSFVPGASNNNRPENRVPMSRLRARIAERLIQSQLTNATLTTFNEVNMQPVLEIRRKLGREFEEEHGVRLGLMSFFMKAAVAALKKFPVVNASIDGNDIVYHGYFDIGIAISSPRGLVVPIMRDVDLMSLADIEKKIAEFSIRAKEGALTLDDLTGGTFSISNGGVFGSMMSTPIINPPQSAILGIHATRERPVVEEGQIVIRPMNFLALSYDHRLIDGSEAEQALVTIKENLEDPSRLLLDL